MSQRGVCWSGSDAESAEMSRLMLIPGAWLTAKALAAERGFLARKRVSALPVLPGWCHGRIHR
jgi:hypothetical protein